MEWIYWFAHEENTKPLALVIFFTVFVGIVLYLYGNKKRGKRLEDYKNIPLQDDESEVKGK